MNFFKGVIYGLSGSGKTSLAGSTGMPTYIVSSEQGLSSLSGVDENGQPIYTGKFQQVTDLTELEDYCTWIAGRPYPIALPNEPFGSARYAEVVERMGGTFLEANGGKNPFVIVDSLTDISRRVMQRSERSDETLTKAGARDGLAVHGKAKKDAEWLLGTLLDLYQGHMVILAVADKAQTPLDGEVYFLKSDTKKASGSIVEKAEQALFLGVGEDETDGPFRYIRAIEPPAGRPGYGLVFKDRSGTLNAVEPPDLSVLLAKIVAGKRVQPIKRGLPASLQ